MNPHPRKDNPPRRESGSDNDSSGTPDEGEPDAYSGQDESVAYDQSGIIYDPGAALIGENQQYGEPEYAYEEPAQGYEQQEYAYKEPAQSAYPSPPAPFSTEGVYDEAPHSNYEEPPPPPPRTTRQKVAGRAPHRRPAPSGRTRPSQHNRPKPAYSGGGISLMTVFLTLIALAMLALVVMVVLPRDMSTVAGYPVNPLATGKPRNLLEESQKIMIQRTSEIAFTEEEVNQYLNYRLQAEQTGLMAALVKFRGVYIDFSPGFAEVVIERELFGMPLTMTSKIKAETFRRQTVYRAESWTLGRIDLGARNIKPVIDLFLRLRTNCTDEYQTIQQMVSVRFEDNKLVLDSRI